jgi:glycosyltransferase involved in cell wall biosynthesis
LRLFVDNVAVYVCLTQFQRRRLIDAGFPADRIHVVPNMADEVCGIPDSVRTDSYVSYVGRVSCEKGVDKLVAAARELPHILFQAAGSYDRASHLLDGAPQNLRFLGFLDRNAVSRFLLDSRFLVLCSIWFEGFPMVVAEAMVAGKAVIASRIGGIPELVEDQVTGLLFEPGDVRDLVEKVRYLWDRPDLCRQMGQAGREKALREYSPERYYERLMVAYEEAIRLGSPCGRGLGQDRSDLRRLQSEEGR